MRSKMKSHALCVVLLVSAASLSAVSFGFGVSGGYILNDTLTSLSSPAVSSETQLTYVPFGASLYADLGYVVVSVGYAQLVLGNDLMTQTVTGTTTTLLSASLGTAGYVVLALMGKYPFALGMMTLSPLVGFELDINVLLLDASGADLRAAMSAAQQSGQSQFWLKTGASLDIDVSQRVYVRGAALFSYKLRSAGEQNAYLSAQHAGFNVLMFVIRPEIELSFGFKM
jgi:hypothetical protein